MWLLASNSNMSGVGNTRQGPRAQAHQGVHLGTWVHLGPSIFVVTERPSVPSEGGWGHQRVPVEGFAPGPPGASTDLGVSTIDNNVLNPVGPLSKYASCCVVDMWSKILVQQQINITVDSMLCSKETNVCGFYRVAGNVFGWFDTGIQEFEYRDTQGYILCWVMF